MAAQNPRHVEVFNPAATPLQVETAAGDSVAVTGSVDLDPGASVAVTGSVTATISGTPAVTVTGSVDLDSGATVDLAANAQVEITNVDPDSNAVHTIDRGHYEVHTGRTFTATAYDTIGAGGGSVALVITVDGAKEYHLVFSIVVTATSTFGLYEDTTLDTPPGGTAVTPANHLRTGTPTASTATAYKDPTTTADGDTLDSDLLNANKNAYVGRRSEGEEWVLSGGKTYMLRVTAAGACTASIHANWYELDA